MSKTYYTIMAFSWRLRRWRLVEHRDGGQYFRGPWFWRLRSARKFTESQPEISTYLVSPR